jgi:hypothetical protein
MTRFWGFTYRLCAASPFITKYRAPDKSFLPRKGKSVSYLLDFLSSSTPATTVHHTQSSKQQLLTMKTSAKLALSVLMLSMVVSPLLAAGKCR